MQWARHASLPAHLVHRTWQRVDAYAAKNLKFNGGSPKLISSDADEAGRAWAAKRVELNNLHLRAFTAGASWDEILREWSQAAEHPQTGNPTIAAALVQAKADKVLRQCPPLHADYIMYRLDVTFGKGSTLFKAAAQSHDWALCTSRMAGEDLQACGDRHLRAYIKKERDTHHNIDESNMWEYKTHRDAFNEQLGESICNDISDPERGQHNKMVFDRELSKRQNQFLRDQRDVKTLSGVAILIDEVEHEEAAYMNKLKRAAPPTGKSPSTQSQRKMAGAVVPAPGDEGDTDTVGGVLPQAGGRGLGGGPKGAGQPPGKGPGGRGGHYRSDQYGSEPPPPEDVPLPRDQRTGGTAPRWRNCAHPTGQTGHPWAQHGRQWSKDDWLQARVDMRELKRFSNWPVAASAWPANAKCDTFAAVSFERVQHYPTDCCKYCFHRPRQPASGPGSSPEEAWFFGTGQGAHDPTRCDCLKRFLAEGGSGDNIPLDKQRLQGILRFTYDHYKAHGPPKTKDA
jgi:hypothetical protein